MADWGDHVREIGIRSDFAELCGASPEDAFTIALGHFAFGKIEDTAGQ